MPSETEKKRYLQLHENLGDGQHQQVIEANDAGLRDLAEYVRLWFGEEEPGHPVTIEIVEMTKAEFDALPET